MRYPWFYSSLNYLPADINYQKLNSFFNSTFDHHLGWEPQPNSVKQEYGVGKASINLTFDALRRRLDFNASLPFSSYTTFGDSFALSRQVKDDQTICHYLGQYFSQYFPNYGVGNYGLDQSFLRAKKIGSTGKYIFIVVPETIVRMNTRWRHLHETGNIFGFKSMFCIDECSSLKLLPNPISHFGDYQSLFARFRDGSNPFIDDPCYQYRFLPEAFNLTRLLSFHRGPYIKIYELLRNHITKSISRHYDDRLGLGNRMLFNSIFTSQCYSNNIFSEPLRKLILQMSEELVSGALIFCVPQLSDFSTNTTSRITFFDSISHPNLAIFDLQDAIKHALRDSPPHTLYVNRSYGGHLNKYGNAIVSKIIASHL